jgi:ATP-dependent Lon protease
MKNNILEFIGYEHHNELVSIANLKGELSYLQDLDDIYQEVKDSFPVSETNDTHVMVSVMFLQAHSEFYVGMSQLLKSHLSKAFFSLRIGIDAAFNAYYFTKHPDHARDFIEEDSPLQKKIFWRIKDHICKNHREFPLAQNLVKIHELASSFAAHSSFQSIVYKYQHIVHKESKQEEIQLNYFDKLDFNNFIRHYFYLLKGYFMVFQLFFNCFYEKEFRVEYPDRDRKIADYEARLNLKSKQYPLSKKK